MEAVDLIVIGSGAAGMTAALTAAIEGLQVLLVEKEARLGGTTAISAGSLWIPNSHHAPGDADTPEQARRYMDATVGGHASEAMKLAFLMRGPEMVRFLADHSQVAFHAYEYLPDYLQGHEGATLRGRGLGALAFDGRALGDKLDWLAPPLPEFTILGGMMVDRKDIAHLLNAGGSARSFVHAARIVTRYCLDRIFHGRATRLVMGNALVARLLASLLDLGVTIIRDAQVDALEMEEGHVVGVTMNGRTVRARKGVVLATGGFSHDPGLRQAMFPKPLAEYSAVPQGNAGDGIRLGLAAGGQLGETGADPAFWAPASVRRRQDGTMAVFPHFVMDRGKPGVIAIGRDGRRFVNEGASYQLFVEAMYARPESTMPAHLVCDSTFLRNYGLGMVHPRKRNLKTFIDEGYIREAPTIGQLAGMIGVDPANLEESVARMNGFALTGEDLEFGKGNDAFSRNLGDPSHGPNPCLGAIATPPFYALAIHPADIATATGLVTDEHARVLDAERRPIGGLYAAGNDMHSVMGGVYPGPGSTLGPAMTFGYVAARHAAGRSG